MIETNQWALFGNNWFMSITMIFGSFIAGASSEGGGAIAFPIMTLIFDIMPHTARNFVSWLLYIIIAVQFIGALIIIRPEGLLLLFTILVFIFGLLFFYGFTRISFLVRKSDAID